MMPWTMLSFVIGAAAICWLPTIEWIQQQMVGLSELVSAGD